MIDCADPQPSEAENRKQAQQGPGNGVGNKYPLSGGQASVTSWLAITIGTENRALAPSGQTRRHQLARRC